MPKKCQNRVWHYFIFFQCQVEAKNAKFALKCQTWQPCLKLLSIKPALLWHALNTACMVATLYYTVYTC